MFFTCHKSFETGTYNNTGKRAISNPPTKGFQKLDHRSYGPHQRGFLRNLTSGHMPKKQHQTTQTRGTESAVPVLLKQKYESQPISSTNEIRL
jgi:hypothetical protein